MLYPLGDFIVLDPTQMKASPKSQKSFQSIQDQKIDTMSYTCADAFFEALYEAGVSYCFVNLGSDHPAIMEAITRGTQNRPQSFPKIITCPNEMVAMSMADGYARATGNPQAVIVHVDVGTQALGCAVHNAHISRSPVLIFAGLCPSTVEGEELGSRTEFVNYLQDIPDQGAIVRQYCRYTNEIRSSHNVKQIVNRALQIAMSAPKGPVYLSATREVFERQITPYSVQKRFWRPVGPSALPEDALDEITSALLAASRPLVITGYAGRNLNFPDALRRLADTIPTLRVLDTSISDMCFPADHPAWLSGRYSSHPYIEKADLILVLDCDVPWVPDRCRPPKEAVIYHIDIDPLKRSMNIHYIDAIARWQADSYISIMQINDFLRTKPEYIQALVSLKGLPAATLRKAAHDDFMKQIGSAALPRDVAASELNAAIIAAGLREAVPANSKFVVEAVTNTFAIYDQLKCTTPGQYIASGATGLGWAGGASLGVKLATMSSSAEKNDSFVTQIVGDGTYLFSAPSSVYWLSSRYRIPILVIILNNKGWNAPRVSLELVHPTGAGSKVSNKDLNISFDGPAPDYPGIAKAASAGWVWTGYARTAQDFTVALKDAVTIVKSGRTAIVECCVKGLDPMNIDSSRPASS